MRKPVDRITIFYCRN